MNARDESYTEEEKKQEFHIDTEMTIERIDHKKYMADNGENLANFLDRPTTGNPTESIEQIRQSSQEAESWN